MNRNVLLLALLCVVSLFWNLGGSSIYILDEAKNAGCAMEMQQRNDWIVPTFNGELRTDKPPLHYYFMRAAYATFGVNPFAARFFSACMAVLLVIVLYRFVKRNVDEPTGLYTSVIFLCSLQVSIQFRLAVPDPYLICFLTLALLFFYDGFTSGKTRMFLLSYGCLALATLAKGPVAVLFYGLIVLLFLLATRSFSWRQLLRLHIPLGIILFLAIVLPWYILVGIETNGEWLTQFFLKHNVGRFTRTMEGHRGFPFASFVVLILGLMPFSFFLPGMLKLVWRDRKSNPFLTLCLIACAVVGGFFAFSRTFLPGYIAPAFPFLAVLLGYYWSHLVKRRVIGTGTKAGAYIAVLVSLAICVALWQGAEVEPGLKDLQHIWLAGLVLVAGSFAALVFLYRGQQKRVFISYATASMVFIGLFFAILYPRVESQNPVKQSLALVDKNPVAYYRSMNPAYVFALKKSLPKLETSAALREFLAQPQHRVITDKKSLKKIDSVSYRIIFEQKDLFERSTTVIIEAP